MKAKAKHRANVDVLNNPPPPLPNRANEYRLHLVDNGGYKVTTEE